MRRHARVHHPPHRRTSIRARHQRGVSVGFALLLLALVVLQGMLGMLTVTWLLKRDRHRPPARRTTTFAAAAVAVVVAARAGSRGGWPERARRQPAGGGAGRGRVWAGLALTPLALQVSWGWTSSNYAAMACPDVPKCQNQWIPAADYKDRVRVVAGPFDQLRRRRAGSPARVAIHFTHRLGAMLATILCCWRRTRSGAWGQDRAGPDLRCLQR